MSVITIQSILHEAEARLAAAGCESPRLDAEILLSEAALGVDRTYLLAHNDESVPRAALEQFDAWLTRRQKREPVAYIVGHREFYGQEFLVNRSVLIPRPETEHLVEEVLALAEKWPLGGGLQIADVGTGSGAIAVCVAVHLMEAIVYALDASPEALAIADENARRHGVESRVRLLQSDLLSALPERVDIVAANLPYVSDAEWEDLAPEIRCYEPEMALRGGPDGLREIRRLLVEAGEHLQPGGVILLEIGSGQADAVRELARRFLPRCSVHVLKDYAGLDRVVLIETDGQTEV